MTGGSAPGEPGRRADRATVRAGIYLLAAILFSLFLTGREPGLSARLFREQDLPVLVGAAGLLIFLASTARLPRLPAIGVAPGRLVWLLAAAAFAAALAGTWLVFGDYPLSRDEILADFDAAILASGRTIAPLPDEWRGYAGALMPQFMLPLSAEFGWLSGYLPGNAALRSLGVATFGPEWVNPLLAAVAIVAVYRIGRRLWPDAPATALLPAILMATSAQVLTMAMTPYAMTAHLAFNLLWLWAFLRDDWKGDSAAFACGFVATGLHQLLFHPLFVLPFLLHLWFSGRRKRALVYVAAYAAIGLFWLAYWQIVLSAHGVPPGTAGETGLPYLVERAVGLIRAFDIAAFPLMVLNLLRLFSWQNIALLPLALLAWPAIRREEGIARPLALGFALTVLTMFILLPWQGHGWGYRYVHGLIGSLCLLAGYGWSGLAAAERVRARRLAAVCTAATILVVLPVHWLQARNFVAPYRSAYSAILRSPADIVLVDGTGLLFAADLVRNAPDLSNRPMIMDLYMLDAAKLRDLCSRYRVAVFDRDQAMQAGVPTAQTPDWGAEGKAELRRLRCAD